MSDFSSYIQPVLNVIPAMFIGVFGGLVSVLNSHEKQRSFAFISSTLVTASFVGLVMHWVTRHYGINDDLASAIIAVSGWQAHVVLHILKKKLTTGIEEKVGN